MQRLDLMFGRKYESNGQEKTAWMRCGAVFIKDDGKISVKLEAVPTGVAGDMWFSAMEPRQAGQR